MKPAIEVKGISKCYTINHKNKASYSTLKDDLANVIKRPLGLADRSINKEEKFWALRDVSFEIPQGEIFGIIGRNGSGKSTMLKIMSRIVEPTTGTIHMHGRTASLLEVGTGFHPELTGRENIYFNGSMLGMSKREISKKFDEIVAFSEVEKFIDTPVKFYSSGMYVRLAFSVAAHLEPDILILDEVLAVGDVGFQKKSLNKIRQTMLDGRTVLFVSHSMSAVQQLCSRGILLDGGKIRFMGDTEQLVDKYNELMQPYNISDRPVKSKWDNDGSLDDEDFTPVSVFVTDEKGNLVTGEVRNDEDHCLNIVLDIKKKSSDYTIGYSLHNQNNSTVFVSAFTDMSQDEIPKLALGINTLKCIIPKHLLNNGDYKIVLYGGIHGKGWSFEPESLANPSIEYRINGGLSNSPIWKVPRAGNIAPVLKWESKKGSN